MPNSQDLFFVFHNFSDNSSPKKPPRPISAVPSEYSDVSTSSCRTSDDGADILDDNKNNNNTAHAKINTHEIDEPVTVSIVVSSPATPAQGAPLAPQEVRTWGTVGNGGIKNQI